MLKEARSLNLQLKSVEKKKKKKREFEYKYGDESLQYPKDRVL